MNTKLSRTGVMRHLLCFLLLAYWAPGLVAQEGKLYPLGPIGGAYQVTGGSSAAKIYAVYAGQPGAVAGLQAGDYIYGAFGQTFSPTGAYHYGVSQELGFAVDRAEGIDGILPLMVLRPGTGAMTINVALPAAGAFGVAYPRNSAKFESVYESAVGHIHARLMTGGFYWGFTNGFIGSEYPTWWGGLALLGHPNWNDTTGAKPYRLSINRCRDWAVADITNNAYAPVESTYPNGAANPSFQGGSSNWKLGQMVIFLAEYYAKTGDSSVVPTLQRGMEMCGNSIQWWTQPGTSIPGRYGYNEIAGMVGHGGVMGDYLGLGWSMGINICGVYSFNGMAFGRRAGMNMNARPKDGHYFGFTLNPGDPIPPAIANALPASITLPQYGEDPVRGATIADPMYYDPSVHQKFAMQLNWLARRSMRNVPGNNDDGAIGYSAFHNDPNDAGGRTPGTLLGMAMYQQDVGGLDAADLDRLERLKGYITRNYMRHQEAHAYCVGAQAYQALCAPYLSDRQQRFFMDNWRFYFALSRTYNNSFQYFPARSVADNYLDPTACAAIDIALPYAIANGRYSLIPGYNVDRTLANFKSPALMWPSIEARAVKTTTSTQAFQIDVCDGNGNVLDPVNYTATWSRVSGPATATFSSSNTANTTVTFPTVSATPYRIRLTVSRAGVPDLVEDIDVTRADVVTPVAPSITTQPVAQSAAPGSNASFSVTVAGTGPIVYQWRLNGVAYWGSSLLPTLNLTNVSSGHVGSYDCVISTPSGTVTSNAAPFALIANLTRVSGGLRREAWHSLAGTAIADLTGYINYPAFPTVTAVANSAEGVLEYGSNYGEKLSGWIKPPVSGLYKFYLSADDSAELWLSTNDSAANKVQIINHPSPSAYRSYDLASAAISLVAGQKYYIEILHKDSSGADHVSVVWQMPGEAAPVAGSAPIDGVYLESDQYLPLLTNLWKLDEASGTNGVDSVGISPATLFNNPTRVAGIAGSAVSFNGVNQYAKATVNVSETVSAVSLWFRTTQPGGGLYSVIDEGGAHDRSIFLNGGNISSYVWSSEIISSTGKNYGDGQWHHVVHTFGGAIGGQKLYVDGMQVAAGAKSQSDFTSQTAIKIGYAAASPVLYFNGTIDDVRIYNAALSGQNAIALHDAGRNATPQVQASTFAVNENAAVGFAVGSVSAADADAGQTLSYSIVGGNLGNRFAINPATGAITVNGALNFEDLSSFLLSVRVTDNGTPAASGDAIVTVNVTNINDAPAFVSSPIRGPSTPAGTPCSGHITAADPDSGDTFTITKMSGPSWLSIAADGSLSGTPSTGDMGPNTFVVRVTDSASAWSEATLEILVVDLMVQPMWINPAGGSWPVAANWMSGTVANSQSIIADFSAPDLTANATVTLDGSRTIGGLIFGDTDNEFGWTLNAGTGGTLTLNATGNPTIEVFNQSSTIGLPIAGTKGLTKTGIGTLALTAANTYTGATAVNAGTLRIGNGTTVGSLAATSPVTIASGATVTWSHSTGGLTIGNVISGSGQWLLQGTNATNALHQSYYTPTADNSGFTGELILNRAMTWNVTSATRLGSGSIRIQDRGTLAVNGGAVIANTIKVENGAGWHHNVSGWDTVYGALRLEGTNTFTGNLQLNHNTGVLLGDGTGANSTFGSSISSNNTFSGIITGTGELSMSRNTSWNGGTGQTANIDIAGTASNTFTGKTIVDGQYGIASLRLMKTGGAIAIPGGNVVQLGSNTGGMANLRMGDVVATGAARNQWNNQFGTSNGGVTLNFVNASGQWMRFDLQGTQQSIAGLTAGSELAQGGAVIQNQNLQAFDPGQDATLTLIGPGTYLYNGYLRDQDNAGTTRKLHLVKAGTGIQTLAGTALTYTGTTTINGGTLRISGTLSNTVTTINSGGRLDGTGTINGAVTLNAGATLSAGGDTTGTLTFANSVNLHDSGTVALRISKSGTVVSNDQIAVTGTSGLAYRGTLTVTLAPGSAPLAAGDKFTLFAAAGGLSANFATINLPALPPTLQWNMSNLNAIGSIEVAPVEVVEAPVFSPGSGGYIGSQSVTISTTTTGATIRYTMDGSDPVTSGTAISGPSPISAVIIPAPANVTINAYAFKAGALDSNLASASYGTVMPDGITWINPSGGSWPTSANWLNGVIPNGSGLTARFDTLTLSGNATVTLNGARTLGGLTFADTGNQYSWTLAPGSGGALTLSGSVTPVIMVNNQPAFISAVLTGSQGLAKSGPGILALSGANTYTGATFVNQGTLQIGLGTGVGSLNAASPVAIASGAAAMWWHNTNITIGNAISGSGPWILQGTNATNALQQSLYTPTGNNSGFTGELFLNRAMTWGVTNGSQLGSGTIRIQDRGTLAVNGATIPNAIIVENAAGWHHNVGGDTVIGAIRMEGTNNFTGNLQLNQNTGVTMGDGTGANSTLGSWSAATSTFSGIISGSGELSMSRFTSWNGGSPQTVNIDLTGTASNTFSGKTVVDGQGTVASLRLMKTGGAIAIPGGNTVQFGTNTGGGANLRMGDTVATGAARSQWGNQFGTANGGVLLSFVNASGAWMRFDLQGTQQSVAGLNAGTSTTQAGAVIQNQNVQAFDPGQDATLTLIGSGTYLYNGYLRDQDNGGMTRKLHLVKSGSGTQTLAGSQIYYSGNTTVNSGRLVFSNGAQQSLKGTSATIASGGTLEWNLTANQDLGPANTLFNGAGVIQKTGTGVLRVGYTGVNRDHSIALAAGGVLDIQAGDLNIGWSNIALNNNQGGLYLAAGAKLHNSQASGMKFDWLSGSGDLNNAYNTTTPVVTIGGANTTNHAAYSVSGNTATFSGRIGFAETYGGVSVGTLSLVKTGAGTQILSGVNGYTGSTTVNGGTLLINGSLANTATTVATGGTLGGTGTITGAVTIQSGGTLTPGSNGIGTLTINNTLSLAGTTAMEVSKSGGTLSADRVSGISAVTYGGALVVSNVGPDSLAAGDSFTLFSATSRAGSFSSITLPPLGSELAWNTSQLSVNGTISIVRTLPIGWVGGDIGSVGVTGTASESSGTYTVSGSGADIGSTADAFQFISQTLDGDGEIRARVKSQTNTDPWAKAGVMIRDGSGAGAINALVAITPGNGFTFQSRSTVSGSTASLAGPALNTAPNNWVRLTRSGTLIAAYVSADGAAWTEIGTVNLTMGSSVSAGIAVTSHNNAVLSTATFDNFSITAFPAPWITADVGATELQGSAEYFGNAYTVTGAGAFGGATDANRYVYQTLSADGSIVARVSALEDSGTDAAVGVMIRDTVTADSRMASLTVNGSGAWNWRTRTTTGGSVSTISSNSGTAPDLWVKLERSGNAITAFRSADGTSWTAIGSATVPMASDCYIGLCNASGSTTTLNTSVMDNVTVVP